MRQESLTAGATFGFTSARSLLAILRLSQALARLRCSNEVNRDDIVEARRLASLSGACLMQPPRARGDTPTSSPDTHPTRTRQARRLTSLSRASIIEAGGDGEDIGRRKDDPTSICYQVGGTLAGDALAPSPLDLAS